MPPRTRLVLCGEASTTLPEAEAIRLPAGADGVEFDSSRFSALGGGPVSDRWLDLLAIATFVYAMDGHVKHGRKDALDLDGMGWLRHFDIVMPVRDLAFWSQVARAPLERAIDSMTGDEFRFKFVQATETIPPSDNLLNDASRTRDPLERLRMVLFSGGMDSLARVTELAADASNVVVPISLHVHDGWAKRRHGLLNDVAGYFPEGRLRPVAVHCRKHNDADRTLRSRPLLLTAIAGATAASLGVDHFEMPENGIIAINLPLAACVNSAKASRTAHPETLRRMERVIQLVHGNPIKILNPYEALTRSEVLDRLLKIDAGTLIQHSVSCSTAVRAAGKDHCGRCSQCVDRRHAIVIHGLEDLDPVSRYEVDPLMGGGGTAADAVVLCDHATLAFQWAASTSAAAFEEANPRIAEAISPTAQRSGRPVDQILDEYWDLHRRHGVAIRESILGLFRKFGESGFGGRLYADSILAVVGARWAEAAGGDRPGTPPTEEIVAVATTWIHGRWTRLSLTDRELDNLLTTDPGAEILIDARDATIRYLRDAAWHDVGVQRRGLAKYLRARVAAPQGASGGGLRQILSGGASDLTAEKHHPYLAQALTVVDEALGDGLRMHGDAGDRTFSFRGAKKTTILIERRG